MTKIERESLTKNIFYKSHKIIDELEDSKWHRNQKKQIDTDVVHSSQALALDVFGFLKYSESKDEIINKVFNTKDYNWNVDFEFTNKDLLNESTSTQIDVLLESEKYIITIECKFTESDGGNCSQTSKDEKTNLPQCNGNYEIQVNPKNNIESYCVLTGKGIKYWDYISEIYGIDKNVPLLPCPFKGGQYQWMRNICFSTALGKKNNKKSQSFICYADFDFCSIKRKMDAGYLDVINSKVKTSYQIKAITYQNLIEQAIMLTNDSEKQSWIELKEWVENKGKKAKESRQQN